jgi:NTP pyrophosphatase (non-canonical NTP hydrolase)
MEIGDLQRRLRATYGARDRARGRDATFLWLVEEIGELSRAVRRGERGNLEHEFSDALAWLLSLADLEGVDMEAAAARYAAGCPRCGRSPCGCPVRRSGRPRKAAPAAGRRTLPRLSSSRFRKRRSR